jgi:hypothetical protein
MDLFLSGGEHNFFRGLLGKFRVKNICLFYPYMIRIPKINWEEQLKPFDKVMVNPGFTLSEEHIERLILFLNTNADLIDFCLDIPEHNNILKMETDVPILPIYALSHYIDGETIAVMKKQTKEVFFRNHLLDIRTKHKIHGVEWVDVANYSANSSAWLLGMRGFTFYFDGERLQTFQIEDKSIRIFLARKYTNLKKCDFDINAIKKDDWKEVAKLNLFAWKQYIDYIEGKYD